MNVSPQIWFSTLHEMASKLQACNENGSQACTSNLSAELSIQFVNIYIHDMISFIMITEQKIVMMFIGSRESSAK